MSLFSALQPVNMTSVEGKIIRANGAVEDLGVIAYWHRNPLRRLAWRLKQFLRGRRAGSITH